MKVPQKPYKKKVMPSTILIIQEKEELYAEIYYPNKNPVETNYTLFQMSK